MKNSSLLLIDKCNFCK